jgi:membrane-associated phospholipid phosphatase
MPALSWPGWPAASRRLLVIAGALFGLFLLVALLVELRQFDRLDYGLLHYLQDRGSPGQDFTLAVLAYIGSIEVTLLVALLLFFPLFKGLRLLAIAPVLLVLAGSVVELAGKHVIANAAPPGFYHRVPSFLPALFRHADANSFPSGHMIRATFLYGLCLYLAERWQLFGRDSSRLSPILVPVIILLGYALAYLGAHWFSDVLGGALLGLSMLIAMVAYLERKRQIDMEETLDF